MSRVAPYQGDFSTGEISPEVMGRTDADRYKTALAKCENFFPTSQGALIRRSGTRFVNEVKDSSDATILVPFEFSVDQSYILEFGDLYMRVYANYGIVETAPSTPFELVTPWSSADLADIDWTQSADVLYVVHPSWRVRKIQRFDDDDWRIEVDDLEDGPYDEIEEPGQTLFTSGLTQVGTKFLVTLTANPQRTVSTNTDLGGGMSRFVTTAPHGYSEGMKAVFKTTGLVLYGPFEITNIVDATTFDCENATLVANDKAGELINPAPFLNENSGLGFGAEGNRKIRLKVGSTWIPGVMATTASAGSYYGTAQADVYMDESIANGTTITVWRRGAYYEGTFLGVDPANIPVEGPGYPSAIAFHEDRLALGGPGQRVNLSRSSDYSNFSPTDPDGTVPSDAAISFSLNQGGVDPIHWFSSDEQGLLMGTAGGEYWLKASSQYEAVSATNIGVKKSTSIGSHNTKPVQAGKATIYVQRSRRKLRELAYFYEVNGFRSTNMSVLAEHISEGGITQLAYQKEPHPIIWAVRADGALLGLSYDRDLDQLRAGWHRHLVGGTSSATGAPAKVESIAVIPSPDGTGNDLWMIVQRFIDGDSVRYVEYMEKIFDDSIELLDAFHVDGGLTYSQVLEDATISKANPASVSKTSHGLSTGNRVRLRNVDGFTGIENLTSLITVVNANTFTLDAIDTSTQSAAGPATLDVYKMATTISGLDHLEGETVSILGDGAVYPDQEVTSGDIVLSQQCAVVHVGYGFTSDAKLVRLDAGAQNGTSIGKKRKISKTGLMLNRSAAFKIGMSFDDLRQMTFRKVSETLGTATDLFTGITHEELECDFDTEGQICIRQDQPLPLTLLAVMPQQNTEDNQ